MLINKLKVYKGHFLTINEFVFKVFLITYFVFYLVEFLKEGFILDFFNLNIILFVVITSGMVVIAYKINYELEKKYYLYLFGFSIIGSILIFLKIKEIGSLSYIIAIFSGIVIYFISVVLLNNNAKKINKKNHG